MRLVSSALGEREPRKGQDTLGKPERLTDSWQESGLRIGGRGAARLMSSASLRMLSDVKRGGGRVKPMWVVGQALCFGLKEGLCR
jgi:hypothetical protein